MWSRHALNVFIEYQQKIGVVVNLLWNVCKFTVIKIVFSYLKKSHKNQYEKHTHKNVDIGIGFNSGNLALWNSNQSYS